MCTTTCCVPASGLSRCATWWPSVMETNLSVQANRMNLIMKKVTSWAAIIAVPTAITGFYGQNLPYPGFGHQSGFIVSSAGHDLVFRLSGWRDLNPRPLRPERRSRIGAPQRRHLALGIAAANLCLASGSWFEAEPATPALGVGSDPYRGVPGRAVWWCSS
ncbi:CorA family divalent cation transporter [Streptomyces sp. NPDC001410]|uniref:CorA family divalent cation transporter n=1 Tax=Streptomyces sp. NPDC001410 TaxID=3364574 RepID=UPI0036ADA712